MITIITLNRSLKIRGCVVANVLDCDIVLSEFELKSRYYIHFPNSPSYVLKVLRLFFYKGGVGIKKNHESRYENEKKKN